MNQLYIYIYPLFFGFPSHLGHHSALSRVPCAIHIFCFCLFRIDEHFKTSPKIPGIDLNSTRVLFEKLMNSQHSMILEQVCFFTFTKCVLKNAFLH